MLICFFKKKTYLKYGFLTHSNLGMLWIPKTDAKLCACEHFYQEREHSFCYILKRVSDPQKSLRATDIRGEFPQDIGCPNDWGFT